MCSFRSAAFSCGDRSVQIDFTLLLLRDIAHLDRFGDRVTADEIEVATREQRRPRHLAEREHVLCGIQSIWFAEPRSIRLVMHAMQHRRKL
jgi:hypothetical protein